MIAEESSISPSPFLTSLESVVRVTRHFNFITARLLINLMVGTTLQQRDYLLTSVDPRITDQEKVTFRLASFLRDWLFDGQAKLVVARLDFQPRVSY